MKAISLFTGAGGFDLGLDRAGIETVLQVECDPYCLRVLERHWPHVRRVTDVRAVGAGSEGPRGRREYRDAGGFGLRAEDGEWWVEPEPVDLVYGGFPCQDLSVAGRRAGLGGERSGLWFEFHRVLRELRPRWALIENVPGLLSSDKGCDFGVILEGLGELWFDVAWAVLDAQHFGVPQRRRRVFIVAGPTRRGCEQVLSLCESCGGNPETRRVTGERIADSLTVGANQDSGFAGEPVEALAIRTANTGSNGWGTGTDDQAYMLDGANGQAVLANPLGAHHGRNDNDLDHDTYIPDVAYAIAAREAKGMSLLESQTNYVAQHGVRRLTPLECERLQGFPGEWTRWDALGNELADSHRYRMMGNAVCVPVAEYIGRRLMEVGS